MFYSSPLCALISAGIIITSVFIYYKFKKPDSKLSIFIISGAVCFTLGILHYFNYENYMFSKVLDYDNQKVTAKVLVTENPGKLKSATAKILSINNVSFKNKNISAKIILSHDETLIKNQLITMDATLKLYEKPSFCGDFDSRGYYASQNTVCSLSDFKVTDLKYTNTADFLFPVKALRQNINNKISEYVKGDGGSLLKALLTGDKSDISYDIKDAMSKSGLSHVIAVSGMHIAIILNIVSILFFTSDRKNIPAFTFYVIFIFMYIVLTGEQPSVVRAGIMALFMQLSAISGKQLSALSGISLATFLMLIKNPFYLLNTGFILSFVATLGVIIYKEHEKSNVFLITTGVFIFIMPFIAHSFNVLPFSTFITGIFASFLVTLILPFGYLMCIFPILAKPVAFLCNVLIFIARLFEKIKFTAPGVPSLNYTQFIILLLCAVTFTFIIFKKNKKSILLLLSLISVLECFNFCKEIYYRNSSVLTFVPYNNDGFLHYKTDENKNYIIADNYSCKLSDYMESKNILNKETTLILSDKSKTNCKVSESLEKINLLYYNTDKYKLKDFTAYINDNYPVIKLKSGHKFIFRYGYVAKSFMKNTFYINPSDNLYKNTGSISFYIDNNEVKKIRPYRKPEKDVYYEQ